MSERIRFIHDYQLGVYTMTELCQRYGVSRKTGHKWLRRFQEGGYEALKDRSRRPHSCPHKTPDHCVHAILEKKRRHPTWGAKKTMTRIFRDFGLPSIIRSDNGTPFASSAIGRISTLSVWWIQLGIFPELIEPAHPEQNGRHERVHRTLKAETARPPAGNLSAQQRRFNAFRTEYNEERPHEALGQETPASFCRPSTRPFSEHIPPIEYPGHFEVRRVSRNGGIRWNSHWVNVSHVLGEQYVGLEEVDDDLWNVYFGPVWLGRFHEKELKIEDALGRKSRRKVLPMYQE